MGAKYSLILAIHLFLALYHEHGHGLSQPYPGCADVV